APFVGVLTTGAAMAVVVMAFDAGAIAKLASAFVLLTLGLVNLNRARYETASALDMPFEDGSFDKAVQLHVGMNIADKSALFREVHRVLRPGGRFGVYDMMSVADGMIEFPVPWATDESMSFVEDLSTYRDALESAGFEIVELRNRRQFAVDFFGAMRAKTAAAGGPPPLGLHLILGKDAPTKLVNMVDGIAAGTIAPVEMICQKTKA
ncbi:MAG: SAM-dependent methyltransferase, partial [Acidimicrobiales bacterium]